MLLSILFLAWADTNKFCGNNFWFFWLVKNCVERSYWNASQNQIDDCFLALELHISCYEKLHINPVHTVHMSKCFTFYALVDMFTRFFGGYTMHIQISMIYHTFFSFRWAGFDEQITIVVGKPCWIYNPAYFDSLCTLCIQLYLMKISCLTSFSPDF